MRNYFSIVGGKIVTSNTMLNTRLLPLGINGPNNTVNQLNDFQINAKSYVGTIFSTNKQFYGCSNEKLDFLPFSISPDVTVFNLFSSEDTDEYDYIDGSDHDFKYPVVVRGQDGNVYIGTSKSDPGLYANERGSAKMYLCKERDWYRLSSLLSIRDTLTRTGRITGSVNTYDRTYFHQPEFLLSTNKFRAGDWNNTGTRIVHPLTMGDIDQHASDTANLAYKYMPYGGGSFLYTSSDGTLSVAYSMASALDPTVGPMSVATEFPNYHQTNAIKFIDESKDITEINDNIAVSPSSINQEPSTYTNINYPGIRAVRNSNNLWSTSWIQTGHIHINNFASLSVDYTAVDGYASNLLNEYTWKKYHRFKCNDALLDTLSVDDIMLLFGVSLNQILKIENGVLKKDYTLLPMYNKEWTVIIDVRSEDEQYPISYNHKNYYTNLNLLTHPQSTITSESVYLNKFHTNYIDISVFGKSVQLPIPTSNEYTNPVKVASVYKNNYEIKVEVRSDNNSSIPEDDSSGTLSSPSAIYAFNHEGKLVICDKYKVNDKEYIDSLTEDTDPRVKLYVYYESTENAHSYYVSTRMSYRYTIRFVFVVKNITDSLAYVPSEALIITPELTPKDYSLSIDIQDSYPTNNGHYTDNSNYFLVPANAGLYFMKGDDHYLYQQPNPNEEADYHIFKVSPLRSENAYSNYICSKTYDNKTICMLSDTYTSTPNGNTDCCYVIVNETGTLNEVITKILNGSIEVDVPNKYVGKRKVNIHYNKGDSKVVAGITISKGFNHSSVYTSKDLVKSYPAYVQISSTNIQYSTVEGVIHDKPTDYNVNFEIVPYEYVQFMGLPLPFLVKPNSGVKVNIVPQSWATRTYYKSDNPELFNGAPEDIEFISFGASRMIWADIAIFFGSKDRVYSSLDYTYPFYNYNNESVEVSGKKEYNPMFKQMTVGSDEQFTGSVTTLLEKIANSYTFHYPSYCAGVTSLWDHPTLVTVGYDMSDRHTSSYWVVTCPGTNQDHFYLVVLDLRAGTTLIQSVIWKKVWIDRPNT